MIPTFRRSMLLPSSGCRDLWNVGIILQHYTSSQHIRLGLESSPPWKLQITTTWRWRQLEPLKLHGVTTLKTSTWNITAVKASKQSDS